MFVFRLCCLHKHGLCVTVFVNVLLTGELYKNGWTNWDAIWWLIYVGPRNHVYGVQIGHGKGHFWSDVCRHVVMSTLRNVHCLPAATGECACPAYAADECMYRRDWWQDSDVGPCGLLSNYFWHLFNYRMACHRLRGSASPVLTATGFVNGKG